MKATIKQVIIKFRSIYLCLIKMLLIS